MDRQGIEALFNRYREAYDRLDAAAAAACFSPPSFVIGRGGIARFGTDDSEAYLAAVMETNAAEGELAWELADLHIVSPAANGAIAAVNWIARRPDRSVLWDFHVTYVVVEEEGRWAILGAIVHDEAS